MESKERTIIVGDVHGCFDELQELLDVCKFKPKRDRLIFLGDLINKGPHSKKVVRFVMEGGFESIVGNHERGFLRSLEDPRYFKKGFKKFYESFDNKKERSKVIEWIQSLPVFIEDEGFICVHGGLQPGVPLEKQKPEIVTRIRTWGGDPEVLDNEEDPAWYELYKEEKLVVFGHWAMRGLIERENVVGLDTGCVWGGSLSALILPERKIVSVEAQQQYKDPHN
ncbi:MAG: metallophosphoesterase [Halobacteriovoraceae bacterium]|nr:metallophosphoesterase [Halobacteriovoraceae bacterium]